jgi:hypothetical protein
MRLSIFIVFAIAAVSLCLASEVEDLGAQAPVKAKRLGEGTKARARAGGSFSGALMTSGSFTMMAASGGLDEEERRAARRDELGEANDWDLTNGGQCEESEEAWVLTDARDHSMGKCVKFAADSKCAPQCFHQGKSVDETEEGAVCTKICRVPGSNGAMCNVIKMVMPQYDTSAELGEGKTMYLTKSKVMQAGLTKDNLGEADPMACAGVATNRRQ